MMSLPIIKHDQRLQDAGIKGMIAGPAKIGKTSLLRDLCPQSTLFVDLEAGGLSVQDWPGDSIEVKDWTFARDLAALITGPDPRYRPDECYSTAHHEHCLKKYGPLPEYKTIFVDSITVAGRLCLQWCGGQPQAMSDKTGKPDNRGKYGLHGQELVRWMTHLQHARSRNVWLVGILEDREDDFGRTRKVLQIDGQKAGNELPGIVDEVISYVALPGEDGQPIRQFVCQNPNPWNLPAGDRSGRLSMTEPPNLAALMAKIKGENK